MVQANELRIGNYLASLNGFLVRVAAINKENIHVESSSFNDTLQATFDYLTPVALTPDILSQCGFVEIGTGANPQTRELETIYEKESFYLSVKDDSATFIIGTLHLPASSLHRLQNLFFDLTGKELSLFL